MKLTIEELQLLLLALNMLHIKRIMDGDSRAETRLLIARVTDALAEVT